MALSLKKVKRAPVVAKVDSLSAPKVERRDSNHFSPEKKEVTSEVLQEKPVKMKRPWSEVVVLEKAPVDLNVMPEGVVDKKVVDNPVDNKVVDNPVDNKVVENPVDSSFFEQRQSISGQYSSPGTLRAWCEVLRIGIFS